MGLFDKAFKGLFGQDRSVRRQHRAAWQEANRQLSNSVLEDLPPPPAPGVDPVTGLANVAVPGGERVAETKHLRWYGGFYQEERGGNPTGPQFFPTADWEQKRATNPSYIPDLLGSGFACRPDGFGNIVCETRAPAPVAGTVGPTDQQVRTSFDDPAGAASRGVSTVSGTPQPASDIYGNTKQRLDDMATQQAQLAEENAYLAQQLQARSLADKQAQATSQQVQSEYAPAPSPVTGLGEGEAVSPSPGTALLIGGALLLLVVLLVVVVPE